MSAKVVEVSLIRDPADWARASGWVSRVRAERAAGRLYQIAEGLVGALGDDEGIVETVTELRSIAKYLAPQKRHP